MYVSAPDCAVTVEVIYSHRGSDSYSTLGRVYINQIYLCSKIKLHFCSTLSLSRPNPPLSTSLFSQYCVNFNSTQYWLRFTPNLWVQRQSTKLSNPEQWVDLLMSGTSSCYLIKRSTNSLHHKSAYLSISHLVIWFISIYYNSYYCVAFTFYLQALCSVSIGGLFGPVIIFDTVLL